MIMVDASGVPLAVHQGGASLTEVKLVQNTLDAPFRFDFPERLIGDKAYDSDRLNADLREIGLKTIASNRKNRKRKTQNGGPLRQYKRR